MAGKNSRKDSTVAQLDKGSLKRVLGVFDLFAIGYGDLGSSIYYALGVTAFFALGATPLAFLLAGFVFVCTALSYAEMSAAFHESGGSASYARHAFNDWISFTAGWGLLLDYIVTIAISAFTIGPYLSLFFPSLKEVPVQIIFTIGVIVALLLLNIWGAKQSTRTSFFLMVFTVLTQLVIIVIGVLGIDDLTKFFSQIVINKPGVDYSPSWDEFFKGTAMAMVAYTGIESIAQMSAETRSPVRTMPRSIIITMFVLIFMYFGLTYVGFSLVSPYVLGHVHEGDPVSGIVANLPWGSAFLLPIVGVLAAVTLFVAANAGLIGASRLSFNMGENYQLPRFLYMLHPKFRTPYTALAFFAILACLVVALSRGKITFLADLYNFGAQIAFFSTQMSLIMLRIKKPELRRPFKVPFNIRIKGKEIPIPAVLGAISSFAVWLLIIITKPDGRYLGFAWMTVGLIMYFAYRRKKKMTATGQLTIHKVKLPSFHALEVRQILLPLRSSNQIETVQMACELAKLHGASIIALHIIEVPFSLPLETALPHRITMAGGVLKIAEAIAREEGVEISMEVVRARNIPEAIIDLAKIRSCDLMVLESSITTEKGNGLGHIITQILPRSPCRIWICHPAQDGEPLSGKPVADSQA
jgi:APA family basic amino acid/polyamine antiporter